MSVDWPTAKFHIHLGFSLEFKNKIKNIDHGLLLIFLELMELFDKLHLFEKILLKKILLIRNLVII